MEAADDEVAHSVALRAEKCRAEIVRQWLGKQPLAWDELCTIDVDVSDAGRWGASRFTFGENYTVRQAHISLRGTVDELLNRVLPHEVTHTVLISYFGRPIPRWADEGAAILAEDSSRKDDYDRRILRIVDRPHQVYSLKYLLNSQDYPGNLEVFYTQSYSVTRFLVELRGRKTFLAFLDDGMEHGWDRAVRAYYPYKSVTELDRAWHKHLAQDHTRILAHDIAAAVAQQVPMRSTMILTAAHKTVETLIPTRRSAALATRGEVVAMPQ